MSHSLHRRGDPEELKNDYVILVTSVKGVNSCDAKPKIKEIIDMMWDVGPSNTGSNETGSMLSGVTPELIKKNLISVPRARVYYYGKEKVWKVVENLREMDTGFSVVVQGPREDIEKEAKERGLHPHSVNLSLDIWGRRDKLPSEDVLEIVTMCGHGLIGAPLVEYVFEKVKSGKMTPEQGIKKLAAPCVCGFFSPERGLKILQSIVPQRERDCN